MKKMVLSAMAALVIFSPALGKSDKAMIKDFDRQVDAIFSAVYNDPNLPGAAVLILKDGKPVVQHCYGIADIETGAPITPNTSFCIASVSKQFAAVALLQLAEQGKLSLNDPVSKFFPEFKAPFFSRITLHHLLSHTSGIPDARDRSNRNFVLYANDEQSPSYMKTLDHLNFEPGTQYEYINPTFQLIYQIVEHVTGISFEEYMQRNVFKKAGMKQAVYFEPERNIPHMAHGYTWNKGKSSYVEYDYGEESFFGTKADGGLYTSVTDFARWEKALRQGKVWSTASRMKAYTPHIIIPANADYGYQPHTGYGYGFFIQQTPGRYPIVYHTGDNGGFTIYAGKIPQHDVVFLFFSTRDNIDRMGMVNAVYDLMEPLGWLKP